MLIQDGKKKRQRDNAEEIAHKTWESKKSVNEQYHDTFEQELKRTLDKMDTQERNTTRWKKRGRRLPEEVV